MLEFCEGLATSEGWPATTGRAKPRVAHDYSKGRRVKMTVLTVGRVVGYVGIERIPKSVVIYEVSQS